MHRDEGRAAGNQALLRWGEIRHLRQPLAPAPSLLALPRLKTAPGCQYPAFFWLNKQNQIPSSPIATSVQQQDLLSPAPGWDVPVWMHNSMPKKSLEDFSMLSVMSITGIVSFNRPALQAVGRCCIENKASPLCSTKKVFNEALPISGKPKKSLCSFQLYTKYERYQVSLLGPG